jgi:eukaryotic-like serine/threonine-protein kinase
MDRERWSQIEQIYYRAVACPAGQRGALLDESCGDDLALRREVESLLAADDRAGGFLSTADFREQISAVTGDARRVKPGQTLGRYELLSEIGAGAMGVVYLARDTALDRPVALKLLPPAFAADQKRAARFAVEAKAASALNHPNILTIHEIGSDGDTLYIATEFVDGVTLRRRIADGPVPLQEALDIAQQCAAALCAAHDAGVIHRDIKPENIMVRRDGLVKVVDFGLARMARATGRDAAGISQAGGVIGTPRYMSPEQARGEPLDARTDVFSLGLVLYELVTAHPAFSGETTAQVFGSLLVPDSLALPIPGDRDLETLIARALQKDRDRRYPTMDAFAAEVTALRQRLTGGGARMDKRPVRFSRFRPGRKTAAAIGAAALALAALSATNVRDRLREAIARPRIESLAVLPLVNVSSDRTEDYLVDGITDQLTADLARATSLRVISRTSAMQFKGTSRRLPDIARVLNVDAVVEGSVRRDSGRVSITAQLLDARRDRHLWARTYERTDSDLPALTAEMARDIGHELVGETLAKASANRPRRVDPAAYELYLRGRHEWNRRTPDGYRKALEHFNNAVDADPTYAPAFAGLADTYLLLGEYLIWPAADAFPRGRAAAERAIALDNTLAQPYASLGQIDADQWRWSDAARDFDRAIERDPAYATARQWRAEYLAASGRATDALAEIRRARDLDPLSIIINAQVGWILIIARLYDEAIVQLRRTIEMAPRFVQAHTNLGIAHSLRGDRARAIAAFEEAIEVGGGADPQLWLAREQALSGRSQQARDMLDRLIPLARQGQAAPSTVALVYVALGDVDTALQWLRRGCELRSLGPAKYPPFDPIRDDPRFVQITRCMALPAS